MLSVVHVALMYWIFMKPRYSQVSIISQISVFDVNLRRNFASPPLIYCTCIR